MSAPTSAPIGKRRGLLWPTVLAVAAFAVLISLGTWQVRRLAWKEALIARVEERIHAAPGDLPPPEEWPGLDPEAIEYRPLRLSGTFDHGREIHVFMTLANPKGPVGGQGYFVLTPLRLHDGRFVFVNRGFVPLDRKDSSTRRDGQVEGEQVVTGLMRPPEEASWLSPEPNPASNVWFVRDPVAMAIAVGLDPSRVAPFTVDAFAGEVPGRLPQGGETVVSFANNHLGYAVTWYGLAAALAAVYAAFVRRRLRGG